METQNNVLGNSVLSSQYFNPDYLFAKGVAFFKNLFNFGVENKASSTSLYHGILIFLAIFFLAIICYTIIRLFEIRKKEHAHLEHEIEEYAHQHAEKQKILQAEEAVSKNPRWVKTLNYTFSENAGDWKLAVLEADSMLEELMGQLGFKGDTLGDKLKSANQDNFRSLTSAWEVHNIRNRVAHEGVNFELTQREAKRIISIYEQIFRDFGYI